MRIAGFQFRPSLIPTLATLVLFPILISLGFWQLDRADQREALQEAFETRGERPPVDLNREAPPEGDTVTRNARAEGTYDDGRQILVDNQTHRSEVGYHVLTPLRLEGRDAALLVDRGWVPGGDDRRRLPDVEVDGDLRTVAGHVDKGPPTGLRLGGMADGETGWPLRVQYLDFAELEERLGYPLLPVVLRLDPDAPDGFVRDWGPAYPAGYGPERNYGYAVQWFALAAALLIIYLTVNTRRVRTDATR